MSASTVAGPSSPPPPGTSGTLADYVLGLADDALVYTQRLGEWVADAPAIEIGRAHV